MDELLGEGGDRVRIRRDLLGASLLRRPLPRNLRLLQPEQRKDVLKSGGSFDKDLGNLQPSSNISDISFRWEPIQPAAATGLVLAATTGAV